MVFGGFSRSGSRNRADRELRSIKCRQDAHPPILEARESGLGGQAAAESRKAWLGAER